MVPRFSHVYEGIDTDLPIGSKLLIQWGTFANQNFILILIVFMVMIGALFFLLKQRSFKKILSTILLENPWIGKQYRLLQLSRFYRSLGLLLSGGIPIIKALQMTQGLLSEALNLQVNQVILNVHQGKNLSSSLENADLTTPVAIRLLSAGERNGQLAEMLEQISLFHDKEVSTWVDKFTRLFEPLLMLVIGLIIGGIVVLLYLPIFELASSFA
ncbi:type II secretion system F family protein [Acinetobacter pittii]|uniref:type II secretion system F family protein n=1 Tax=Acinetobacter pittii TaxID=48296 RepID=UPI0024DE6A55|nr:type II secretion system F family protein [Acinetobacter pittii]